jgi:hypothetical protein
MIKATDIARWRLTKKSYKGNTGYGVVDSWVADALAAAKAGLGLVDLPLVGDSNTTTNSSGWLAGLPLGFKDRGGKIYSTGLVGAGMAVGSGFAVQHWTAFSTAIGAQSGAPANLDDELTQFQYHAYAYITAPAGIIKRNRIFPAIFGAANGETWRYWMEYGDFAAGGGSFVLRTQLDIAPYTVRAESSSIACNVGDNTKLAYLDFTVPTQDVHAVGITSAVPNVWLGYSSVDRLNIGGICTHYLASYGGWLLTGSSATSFLKHLKTYSQTRVGAFLARIRRKQMLLGYAPKIIIAQIWGANDTSVGAIEFKSNLLECMDWFRAAYALAGGQDEELGFLLMADHRYDDVGSAFQLAREAFSAACDEIALSIPRVASFNLQTMFTAAEGDANGWYPSPADHSHLSAAGYRALAERSFQRVFGL